MTVFMDCIEWLAEARCLPDTTAIWVYPLAWEYDQPETNGSSDYTSANFIAAIKLCSRHVLVCAQAEGADPTSLGCQKDLAYAYFEKKPSDLVANTGAISFSEPFATGSFEYGAFPIEFAEQLFHLNLEQLCQMEEEEKRNGPEEEDVYVYLRVLLDKCDVKFEQRLHTKTAGCLLRGFSSHLCMTEAVKDELESTLRHSSWESCHQGPEGETAVHMAAGTGNHAALQILLRHRPQDVNAQDLDGETPLHYAAFSGRSEAISLLLANGADPSIESYFVEQPRHVAEQCPAYFLHTQHDQAETRKETIYSTIEDQLTEHNQGSRIAPSARSCSSRGGQANVSSNGESRRCCW